MSDARATRAARESIDNTMATGAETIRGVQEGFTSAVENVRDLNLRLIDMAQANTQAAFDFAREVAEAKGLPISSRLGLRTRRNNLTR
jgi:cysteine synthase